MKSVTTRQAKRQLFRLLSEVEAGEEVIIRRGDKVLARLTAVQDRDRRVRPPVGTTTSAPVWCAPDAFAPLTDEELGQWGA
jgi:antitoxin (DNA-binding transcriptional repressor) of toxin-antitoxin stability system